MSAVSSESGQDFDLNIAPIIDCFTVLITYLLVSASFLSLSVLEVGVAASGDMAPPTAEPQKPKDPPLTLEVFMKQSGEFTLKVTGGAKNINWVIPLKDRLKLKYQLTSIIRTLPEIKEANLSAEPTLSYKDMIKVIEELKPMIPKIYIAGT